MKSINIYKERNYSQKRQTVLEIISIYVRSRNFFDYLRTRTFFLPTFSTFNESFKFLKNCQYDFYKIWHSHFTPRGAPACAITSKSYDSDLRNAAKISSNVTKKRPFLDFFRFPQKLSIRFERIFLQSFYAIFGSVICFSIFSKT